MTVDDLISALVTGFGVSQSASRLQHAALVEAGRFERRSTGTTAKPVARAEAMHLIFSVMASGGKGDAVTAIVASDRLKGLTLDRAIATKQLKRPPLSFVPGETFAQALERLLEAVQNDQISGWLDGRRGDLVVEVDHAPGRARISLLRIEPDGGGEVLTGVRWEFGEPDPAARANRPCPTAAARRRLWTTESFEVLGQALRGA